MSILLCFQAEEYIDMFEFEMAQKFCQRALELEPDNVQALETCGTLLLELGELKSAKHVSCQHWLSLRGDLKNDQCTTTQNLYNFNL